MPYRISTSRARGWTPVALCRVILALLHLSMVATAHAAQQTLAIPQRAVQPYLATINSPSLRYRAAASTAPLVRKTIATGSPVAASAPEVAEVALANDHAAASTPPIPVAQQPEQAKPESTPVKPSELPPVSKAQPILPDDTRRKVQSQDFLPLFRFPGSDSLSEDVSSVPAPPVPGTLPPSSATYRQQ